MKIFYRFVAFVLALSSFLSNQLLAATNANSATDLSTLNNVELSNGDVSSIHVLPEVNQGKAIVKIPIPSNVLN